MGALDRLALLKVPLVLAGVVQDETPLMVEITVADDVTIGQSVDSDISYGLSDHRQPKLRLRAAHKLDCFATLCIIMLSATFKSLYGNDTKRLKLPQIREKSK